MARSKPTTRRILIVQTAFIGDVILITPLIRAVSELYPDARIDALTVPGCTSLLANNPHLNDVIAFNKKRTRMGILSLAGKLRARAYDMAISPHSSFTTHFLLWLSGAKMRIGYARGFLSSFFMTHRVPHPKGIHKILKNLSLLKPLTNKEFSMDTELFPAPSDEQIAVEMIKELGEVKAPLIALAPGSIWATKCWPLEYYQELAQGLAATGYGLFLVGSAEDAAKCDIILRSVKEKHPQAAIVNTAGHSGLLASAAMLRRAQLLVCNDSGALHLANAVRTKVFAFFGPTVRRIGYYPYRDGDHVFEMDMECRPCGSHGGKRCPLSHHNCMRQILPGDVSAKIHDVLPLENLHA